MGTADRSKRRDVPWKKAILHFSMCFAMGFFTGFAPATTSNDKTQVSVKYGEIAPAEKTINSNRSLMDQASTGGPTIQPSAMVTVDDDEPSGINSNDDDDMEAYDKQLILVTTTRSGDPFKRVSLERLAHTLKLVPAPLLWIVVEARSMAQQTAVMLRMTGVMYRHLVFKENFTGAAAEVDYQRNHALKHIKRHRLDGIVHFADLANVYNLHFFDEIRHIESFGTWPVASVSTNRKRVRIEGPVCASSSVLGWHLKDPPHTTTTTTTTTTNGITARGKRISYFAFNSSILWDPERWGRSPSVPDAPQDSMKFVQKVIMEDESQLMAFPPDCSSVMVWKLHIPRNLFLGYSASIQTPASDRETDHT